MDSLPIATTNWDKDMQRKLIYCLVSIVLLSVAWLGGLGFTTLVGLVPLLLISSSLGDSARDWWRMAGWAALTFVGWNVASVWWIANATPIGPVAATFFSSWWMMVAFMLFHYVSKRAPKVIAYTILVAAWVATEHLYTHTEVISFPWLALGNAFSQSPWAVQWYSLTGVEGGSMWVMLCNIAALEAWQQRTRISMVRAVTVAVVPVVASLIIYWSYEPASQRATVAVVQPNVDCYEEKFNNTAEAQMQNLQTLLAEVPSATDVVVMPETALPGTIDEEELQLSPAVSRLRETLRQSHPETMVAVGASTVKIYESQQRPTTTARTGMGFYYDVYNSAIAINGDKEADLHHKMRLVIGVEAMPAFVSRLDSFIDLGGITGQLGRNDEATVFHKREVVAGPAICYEGLYGDAFARFVREGANLMLVMSNDGWWGNTPGHKRLFDFCRLRAIETRRAIARSANTGVSGFITSRGDVRERMDWDERGVLTDDVELSERLTPYVIYGDWVGRMSLLMSFLGIMYFSAYRIRRRNHLVD